MDSQLMILIILVVGLSQQETYSYKLPSNSKLENGENLLGAISNRIELKTKCTSCKIQNKCKAQDNCLPCEEICDKYQQSSFKKPVESVGMAQRSSENASTNENEDRYYTVGAFKEGPIQRLLQKLLNLSNKSQTDHMIIMVKPKSKNPRPASHPVVIDTAHVFTTNDGNDKRLELELHKVKNVNKPTEELVEKLDEKFENIVEDKKKANMDPHLMPEEIDEIIEEALGEENKPQMASRLKETNSTERSSKTEDELIQSVSTPISEPSTIFDKNVNELVTETILSATTLSQQANQKLQDVNHETNSNKTRMVSGDNLSRQSEVDSSPSQREFLKQEEMIENEKLEDSPITKTDDKVMMAEKKFDENTNLQENNQLGVKMTEEEVPNNEEMISKKITTSSKRVLDDDENEENQSLLPKNIDGPVKLVPSLNREAEGEAIESAANKAINDATLSVQENNEKIKDLVQQIFPESLTDLPKENVDETSSPVDEIKLTNNQKFRTSLTPEEQMKLNQEKNEPTVAMSPQPKDIYSKHPRIDTIHKNGRYQTIKRLPENAPFESKHRDAESVENQPSFIETTKDDGKVPFVDKNLLNMDSLAKNIKKSSQPDLIQEEDDEHVACSKESEENYKYLNVEPPYSNKYDDDLYRAAGLNPPKLPEFLTHHKKLPLHLPNFPLKNHDKLPRIHHSDLPVYRSNDDDNSSEENNDSKEIVEAKRHQGRNSFHQFRNLGKLIPRDHVINRRDIPQQVKHKNMFFVGDGIKLPLTLKEFHDGSLHLSIDVKALCNCKHCNGRKHHNITDIVGDELKGVEEEEIADIPIKVYEENKLPANAIPVDLDVTTSIPSGFGEEMNVEGNGNNRLRRSPWDNRIEKIDEAQITPEKYHFLKDIFSFMKNLVSDDIHME
ncbi:uncharacterized protein [Onthophagus taurus]|uniref:uncharacterized protein n=1 Tax=Onthophagus taurus TaxID=166361 RepID=UPI0039BE1365